ncbi:hypothetical protein ACQY0O_004518 [Thecaphora frezii]
MSAVTMNHPFNAFYAESDTMEHDSFEQLVSGASTSKTRELARAVGRDLAGHSPSYRPPSGWSVDTRNADVVWHGDGSRAESMHEDQFSDAESWDADHGAWMSLTPAMDDDGRSTFGHVRNSSVGSSIFTGRGVQPERKRKEVPPPLPLMPTEHLKSNDRSPGSSTFAPASPMTANSHYESTADHTAQPQYPVGLVRATADQSKSLAGWQMPRAAAKPSSLLENSLPSRSLSRSVATLQHASEDQGEAEGRSEQRPDQIRASRSFIDTCSSSRHSQLSMSGDAEPSLDTGAGNARRLPDGTVIPKLPPVPTSEPPRKRSTSKQRNRKDRSPMITPEDAAEEKELQMMAEADDGKRMSALGPRLKKNSPAPWELGGVEEEEALPRPSLRETLRGSNDGVDRSFVRFRTRPSIESQAAPMRQGVQPSSGPTRNAAIASIEEGTQAAEPTPHEGREAEALATDGLHESQRSRSKSVSNSAAATGVLKGLGLAPSAGPATRKSKLAKAFRLGREDKSGAASEAGSDPPQSPFESSTFAAPRSNQPLPGRSIGYKKNSHESEASLASPTFRNATNGLGAKKPSPDLTELILASNGKYQAQAYSPNSSPRIGSRKPLSPRVGGGLALPYKRSPHFAAGNANTAFSEGDLRASASRESQLTIAQTAPPASTSQADSNSEAMPPKGAPPQPVSERVGSGESSRPSTVSEVATPTAKSSSSLTTSKFPGVPDGMLPTTGSQGAGGGGLPMPGFHHGVQYKLISLEQARKQLKYSSDCLAPSPSPSSRDHAAYASPNLGVDGGSSMKHSSSMQSFQSGYDEPRSRQPSEGGLSQRAIKNKKSNLFRIRKKDKGSIYEVDAPEANGNLGPRDSPNYGQTPGLMPSLSITGSDLDGDNASVATKDVTIETPALSLRPVSSMFVGLGANFFDSSFTNASDAPTQSGTSALTATPAAGSLLAPYSPALASISNESSNRSSLGTHFEDAQERLRTPVTASPASVPRPIVANISPTPHTAFLPGPKVPGSAGSHAGDRMPSLDAGGSTNSEHSRFHSPATSPITPSFNNVYNQLHGKRAGVDDAGGQLTAQGRGNASPLSVRSVCEPRAEAWLSQRNGEAKNSLSVSGAGSPNLGAVPEEVKKRAIELEEQIKQLASELHQLREVHLSSILPSTWAAIKENAAASVNESEAPSNPIQNCPCCGCGCAEQRRLQSLNEAAVLKGVGVLDRGRALKPSSNLGNTGKFGGYLNR